MDTLLEIVAEIIAWVTGAKTVESFDKKDRKKAYLFGTVFLLVVFGMGAYSIYWFASKLIGH
jgi:hypothetical protein